MTLLPSSGGPEPPPASDLARFRASFDRFYRRWGAGRLAGHRAGPVLGAGRGELPARLDAALAALGDGAADRWTARRLVEEADASSPATSAYLAAMTITARLCGWRLDVVRDGRVTGRVGGCDPLPLRVEVDRAAPPAAIDVAVELVVPGAAGRATRRLRLAVLIDDADPAARWHGADGSRADLRTLARFSWFVYRYPAAAVLEDPCACARDVLAATGDAARRWLADSGRGGPGPLPTVPGDVVAPVLPPTSPRH